MEEKKQKKGSGKIPLPFSLFMHRSLYAVKKRTYYGRKGYGQKVEAKSYKDRGF